MYIANDQLNESITIYQEKNKMTLEMLKGKIHRATVTQAELDYVGSIAGDCKFRSKSACNTARRYFQRMA